MPPLSAHQSAQTTKMIFLGDSGAGKTGALASLAGAGYNLRIIDVDNGLDVLANLLKDTASIYGKEALDRVVFETVTDPMRNVGGKLIPKSATVWQRVIKLLENWPGLGPITTWTNKDILVIDSLTMLSTAALNFILSMNARLGNQPYEGDWYNGQQLIEGLLQMLYDEGVKCNIIVISHITFIGKENGPVQGYPNTLGKALPPKVGRYFNTALMAKTTGSGTALKRKILTNTSGVVELKNTAPNRVAADYPLETGLAEYFKAVRTEPGGAVTSTGPSAPVTSPVPSTVSSPAPITPIQPKPNA